MVPPQVELGTVFSPSNDAEFVQLFIIYCGWYHITFLNKAGVTLSCRGSKKIPAPETWESLEFNLDVGSITLCLVPQLFMLELMAAWCLQATTWIWQVKAHRIHHALHISIFYFSCLLHVGGGQGTLPVLVNP
jgi:hypothetical protein